MLLKQIVDTIGSKYSKEELEAVLTGVKPTEFNSKESSKKKVDE